MLHLAIETSDRAASVALFDDAAVLATARLASEQRTAQTLAPAIQTLFREASARPRALRLVSVAAGPGSFTGLRIGVTAAKTLCFATGSAAVAIDTLHAVAAQAIERSEVPSGALLAVAMNAYRGQVYRALYRVGEDRSAAAVAPSAAVVRETWLRELHELAGARVFVAGPVLEKTGLAVPAGVAPTVPECWRPEAVTVGRLGWQRYQGGERDDFWTLQPHYLRRSAAEDQAERR